MSGNPTELGNLIREAAEGHQQKPAHTLILGVKASDFPHKSCNFTFCEAQ